MKHDFEFERGNQLSPGAVRMALEFLDKRPFGKFMSTCKLIESLRVTERQAKRIMESFSIRRHKVNVNGANFWGNPRTVKAYNKKYGKSK